HHSNGLVTTDVHTQAPVGRLAERVPSLDAGTVVIQPDGRMKVTYKIRTDVTWQDGAPFSADDVMFGYEFCCGDINYPGMNNKISRYMDAAESPDPTTFIVTFKGPIPDGLEMGPHALYPLPRHILHAPFDRYKASGDANELTNLPYWTSEYIHTGPFMVDGYDPGVQITFKAYPNYFLGRPKLDQVILRMYGDSNALMAGLLAGETHLIPPSTLKPGAIQQLRQQWQETGGGQ